jgi:two-component system LytT family response regulator
MINVLLVDDEPLAREGVRMYLEGHKDVHILGECENAQQAIERIHQLNPDLVFLDIKMPNGSGFDVIKTIGSSNMPLVIFLTAYDQYAIDAFKINALDYLLKPINPVLFDESLNRARKELEKNRISTKSKQLSALLSDIGLNEQPQPYPEESERIVVRSSGHIHFIRPEEIIWVQADGDYIHLHTDTRSHLIRETMRSIEQRLTKHGFHRIHRSAIVRISLISEMITSDNGDYEVILNNGSHIKMSRHYRDALLEKLSARP